MINASAINLINQEFTVNDVGDSIETETSRRVFADVKSVGLKRKMEAEQFGLKLELKFVLSDIAEYKDEQIVEYNGKRYNIVSTYAADDGSFELTTARF